MGLTRFRHCISMMMAVVLLSLAVVSRAPQSKCRCHEKRGSSSRSQKQEQKPCVFGQLRTLTASFVLPASVEPEERPRLALIPIISIPRKGVGPGLGVTYRPRARSPPVFDLLAL